MATTTTIPTELATAWQHTLEQWTSLPLHDTLLGLAAKHKNFAWLAARYRDAARTNPSDTIATERLARVARATIVMTAFESSAVREAPAKKGPFKAFATLLVAAAAATGFCMYLTEYHVQHNKSSGALVSHQP